MRIASIAVVIALSALGMYQDPVGDQDEEEPTTEIDDLLAPFTAYREEERTKNEALITGAWRLVSVETSTDRIDARSMRGFAMFYDGYVSLVLIGEQVVQGFLTIDQVETQVQAGIHRYQISDLETLQTASIMGFSNPDVSSLIFDEADETREFLMELDEHELRLNHPDGHWLVFRKMGSGVFPVEALRALERKRAGRNTTPDWDPDDPFDEY